MAQPGVGRSGCVTWLKSHFLAFKKGPSFVDLGLRACVRQSDTVLYTLLVHLVHLARYTFSFAHHHPTQVPVHARFRYVMEASSRALVFLVVWIRCLGCIMGCIGVRESNFHAQPYVYARTRTLTRTHAHTYTYTHTHSHTHSHARTLTLTHETSPYLHKQMNVNASVE